MLAVMNTVRRRQWLKLQILGRRFLATYARNGDNAGHLKSTMPPADLCSFFGDRQLALHLSLDCFVAFSIVNCVTYTKNDVAA
jgi:hypothetical protein